MPDPVPDIHLLVLDVDGVLTDGGIYLDDRGFETKRFHVRDGLGIRLWMNMGHEVAVITGRSGGVVRHRCDELGIRFVVQGSTDKAADFEQLLQSMRLEASQAAMLADDLPDLPIMTKAGYPMAVADASAEVRDAAAFVTVRPGGHGAVREAVEHLLKAKDEWDRALEKFR